MLGRMMIGGVALAAVILPVTTAAASSQTGFYQGKTVTILVGFSAGGGYDTYARTLARHLSAHIPGNPNVIVRNMPGAGSLVALRSLNVTQPKDGTVMLTFNPGLITRSLVQPKKVNFDLHKYAWVGIATPDFRVCYGFGPKGVKSWKDMMHTKRFILGATSKSSSSYIDGALLREVFHAPIKQVLGFPGSADKRLAIERGELDGDCITASSIPAEWIRNDKARVFVRFTKERTVNVPSTAPFIESFATTHDQKNLLRLFDAVNEVGKSYIMSSDVPANRLAVMRKAFAETMNDPGFLADAKKERIPVHPLSGARAQEIVSGLMTVSPSVIAQARKIYE